MGPDNNVEIFEAVENLPQHLRTVAQMHFLNNQSYSEIAKQLSITQENAGKRVQLSRELLNKAGRPGSNDVSGKAVD